MGLLELLSRRKGPIHASLYGLFAVFIFFMAGFRGMGNDYDGYREIFESIRSLQAYELFDPSKVYVEPIYGLLNIAMSELPYQAILVVMAFLNIVILFPFIYKYSPYPFVSLLLFAGMFMYSNMMGLIRQSLAVSICLWAIVNVEKRRFWWLVGIATLIHYSAIIVVVVKLIKNNFLSLKRYMLLGSGAIVSNLFFYGIFITISALLPAVIAWKLSIYISEEAGDHFGLMNSAVLLRLVTFILAYRYRDKIKSCFPEYGAYFTNIYFMALLLYVGCGFLPQMASRGAAYFHFFEILVVPMLIYVANKANRCCIFSFYALCSFWRHYELVTMYQEAYVPYKNVLLSFL
ncbi:MAG: EpsG family protein [Alistipes senegalensis]|nr:EpsG family protein [Bacteroides cellulosilyticus]MCM1352542.1 EpsG family protein [Alistipes senegalensis]